MMTFVEMPVVDAAFDLDQWALTAGGGAARRWKRLHATVVKRRAAGRRQSHKKPFIWLESPDGKWKRVRVDMTGKRIGRLVVMAISSRDGGRGQRRWWCRCDCGNEVQILSKALASGYTLSCGCLRQKISRSIAKRLDRDWSGLFLRRVPTDVPPVCSQVFAIAAAIHSPDERGG